MAEDLHRQRVLKFPGAFYVHARYSGMRYGVPAGAFSSEVETGSRQENASNQESRAPF
jgi:hypothetical protein